MSLTFIALLAFAVSAALTRAMIPWLARRGAVAAENHRTMHAGTIPKGGGLAVLLAATAALLAAGKVGAMPVGLAAGLLIASAISWADDIRPLPAVVRLPIHVAAAAAFVLSLQPNALVFQGLLPLALDRALTILALAWMMNLFNFMDGINGLAGTEMMAIAAGFLLVALAAPGLELQPLAAALLGASAGFLIWNLREKALVFLGDVGSIPFGYLAGALMIDLAVKGFWPAALILPAYFVADASLTLARRFAHGEKIWQAHRTHLYQRAASGFGAHLPVVWRVAAANTSLIAAALWSRLLPLPALAFAAIVLAALFWLLARAAASCAVKAP